MSTPNIPCRKYPNCDILPKNKIDEATGIRKIEKSCGLEPYAGRYRTKKGYSYAYDINPIPQNEVEDLLKCIVKAGIKKKVFGKILKIWISEVKWNPVRRSWRTIRIQISHDHAK